MAVRQPRQQVGGGRGDDDAVGPACQFDMAHRLFGGAVPQGGAHRLPGQGLETQRRDELLRTVGHGHLHVGAGVAQAAHQLQRFVGGDAAADAQQQLLSVQRPGRRVGILGKAGHVGKSYLHKNL